VYLALGEGNGNVGLVEGSERESGHTK